MSVTASPVRLPVQAEDGLLQLEALAALIRCADPERWASLGRPSARGLSALISRATCDVESGLDELGAARTS